MDFGRYLLFKGVLTLEQYKEVLSHQFGHGVSDPLVDVDEVEDLSSIRTFPFGVNNALKTWRAAVPE